MDSESKGMRSIWFFVGLILLVNGIIIVIAGVYDLFCPDGRNIRLANLHTNIWWGFLVALTGAIYIIKNKNKYI